MRVEVFAALCAAIGGLGLGSLPARATPPPESDPSFLVFFKSNSTDLDERALKTLKQAAIVAIANGRGPILVMGRQDAGELDVAVERASAVAIKLKELGVPTARTIVTARNDLEALRCATLPGIPSTCNAAVEIAVCASTCSDETRQRFNFNRR